MGQWPVQAEALDLQPVGEIDASTLDAFAARLSRRVSLACHVLPPVDLAPRRIPNRDQVDAASLLERLEAHARANRVLVGITAEDIAIPIFTFVFGLARQGASACIVSTARLDPGFYGLPPDSSVRDRRAMVEALHEMGHLAMLGHCADVRCLMNFAGNVERLDARGIEFCDACAARVPSWMRGHHDL